MKEREYSTPGDAAIADLRGALRELVEKAEALFEAMKHTSVTSRELDGLRQAATKARVALGEKEKSPKTCLVCGMDDEPLESNGVCKTCNIELNARAE